MTLKLKGKKILKGSYMEVVYFLINVKVEELIKAFLN